MLAVVMLSSVLGAACRREIPVPIDPPVDPPIVTDPPDEPTGPVEPAPQPQGEPLRYILRVRTLTLVDGDGTVLAKARCTVPEIANESGHSGIAAINGQLAESQQAFLNWVAENAPEVAREDRSARKQDFSFHLYESWSDVQYNGNGIFSVLTDDYFYSGGAHPSNFMKAANFVVESGVRLRLAEVWGKNAGPTMSEVYAIIAQQIEGQRGTDSFGYYDDYQDFYREFYDPDDFVITPNGLTVFYQPYTISPYAAGIPQFNVPFEQFPDTAMALPAIEDREWERDLHWAAGALLERNYEVAFGMYFLGWLAMDTPGIIEFSPGSEHFYLVTDPRFPNLAALRNFLRSTYVHTQVDALLAEERYVEKEGTLYGDFLKDGGMGYYLDWSDFRFYVSEMAGDTAEIAILLSGVHPGDYEPTTETKFATLVMVNRNWLLQRLVY
jgi:hypothetical protein